MSTEIKPRCQCPACENAYNFRRPLHHTPTGRVNLKTEVLSDGRWWWIENRRDPALTAMLRAQGGSTFRSDEVLAWAEQCPLRRLYVNGQGFSRRDACAILADYAAEDAGEYDEEVSA